MADGSHDDRETLRRSYSYVRAAMVALLVGLAVAVFYESDWQGPYLASVSAYYYTPAQAMFVGALVGLGTCMIALRGTNSVEDIFLNLGGMFAAVVAIVPTTRDADHRAALRACREQAQDAANLNCPSLEALDTATRLDIENNMVALLVLGALGMVAAVVIMWLIHDRHRGSRASAKPPGGGFWVGLPAAFVVWVAAVVTFVWEREWFIDHAHIVAAIALCACVVVVVAANAFRRKSERQDGRSRGLSNFYTWLAVAMVAVLGVLGLLLYLDVVTLFWLEMAAAALFIAFWLVQTVERARTPVTPPPPSPPVEPVPGPQTPAAASPA